MNGGWSPRTCTCATTIPHQQTKKTRQMHPVALGSATVLRFDAGSQHTFEDV
jgi:hypothetical protein